MTKICVYGVLCCVVLCCAKREESRSAMNRTLVDLHRGIDGEKISMLLGSGAATTSSAAAAQALNPGGSPSQNGTPASSDGGDDDSSGPENNASSSNTGAGAGAGGSDRSGDAGDNTSGANGSGAGAGGRGHRRSGTVVHVPPVVATDHTTGGDGDSPVGSPSDHSYQPQYHTRTSKASNSHSHSTAGIHPLSRQSSTQRRSHNPPQRADESQALSTMDDPFAAAGSGSVESTSDEERRRQHSHTHSRNVIHRTR